MFINHTACTIEMTKKELKAAGRYNSEDYKALKEARQDNPGYEVAVRERRVKTARTTRKDTYKGLTYAYMECYIAGHDEEEHIMAEYNKRRCLNEDPAQNLPAPLSYSRMKKWFLEQYPEIAEFCEDKKSADAA